MKMMKSPIKNPVFYLVTIFIILFTCYETKYLCGNEVSKSLQETLKNSKSTLKYQHILEFIGLSGKSYKIDLNLYSYNKSLLNLFVLDSSQSNIKYTAREFYNIFNHIFMNVYIEPEAFKMFLKTELKDVKKLSESEIEKILIAQEQNAINFILTKQVLTRILLKSGEFFDVTNIPISDFLINGETNIQYITTLAQIINAGKLADLLKYFSTTEYLDNITSGQSELKLFQDMKVSPDCLDYIYNLTSDLVDLYNQKVPLFKPNTNLVLNNVTITDKNVLWSKYVLQETVIEKPKFVTLFMDSMNKSMILDSEKIDFLNSLKKKNN